MDFKPELRVSEKLDEMSSKLNFSKNIIVRIVIGYVLNKYSKEEILKVDISDRNGSAIPLLVSIISGI